MTDSERIQPGGVGPLFSAGYAAGYKAGVEALLSRLEKAEVVVKAARRAYNVNLDHEEIKTILREVRAALASYDSEGAQ